MVLLYNLDDFPLSTLARTPKRIALRRPSQLGVEDYVTEGNMSQCASIVCDANGRTTMLRGGGIVTSHVHLLFPM